MKKKGYLIAIAVLLVFGAVVWFREPIARAAGDAFGLVAGVVNNIGTSGVGDTIATSSLNYLTSGTGTTSVTVNTAGTDQLDVNVFEVASSTLTDLRARVEVSHSTSSVPADQLWFPAPQDVEINIANASSVGTTTTLAQLGGELRFQFASTTKHRIATSTAMNGTFDQDTTTAFSFRLKNLAAQWVRVLFYIPTGSQTDSQHNTLANSTALSVLPTATSTNAGIRVYPVAKQPL